MVTKGEWELEEVSEDTIRFYGYEDGFIVVKPVDRAHRFVATIPLHHHSLAEIKANANLIAAPDLYEALRELMERLNGGIRFPLQSTCDKANEALAKAEGK